MSNKLRLKVLIVDHDAIDRMAVEKAVSSASIPISLASATTLASGLAAVEAQHYDCVLLDWYLPDGDGAEFLERLALVDPNVPVIVLTSPAGKDGDPAGLALKAGAQDYLEKEGLDATGLVRSIRYAIKRKRAGELKEQLLHSDRLGTVGQLAAGVAHEVNNPATWVVGNLALLREQLDGIQLREGYREDVSAMLSLVEDCRRGMERIVETVRDLKRYAQPSPPRNDLLDLNAVVREAHRITRLETRHRARVELVLRDVPPLKGDAGTLGQLVINMLINAARALDKVPSATNVIRISTVPQGPEILLVVEDSGPGVPQALRERIFEPFFTTGTDAESSGMGLAICRDIVRRHQGRLGIADSELGGARFEVRLPCEDTPWDDMDTRTIRRVAAPKPKSDDLRVLVVDDEPQILQVVSRLLTGCDVVTAGNGIEALTYLRKDAAFDGVLCDLMMPDMDGAELIQTISQEIPEVSERVVLCTGGAVTPQLGNFLAQTSCLVLHKPFGQGELAQIVDHWRDLKED